MNNKEILDEIYYRLSNEEPQWSRITMIDAQDRWISLRNFIELEWQREDEKQHLETLPNFIES